ncbi:MAG: cytochrome c oxidase assembly protein [Betaproteobacteria bacterium]|nr:MAG: cytochrome c oxidase assembly protein [Betaproteobacteria bacterium]
MIFNENQTILKKLTVFTAVMFAFGFALVPIYQKICEVTGVNDFMRPEAVKNTQVDKSRTIKVEFDANTRNLPWNFRPEVTSINVHPGELTTVVYEVSNTTARDMIGQAIPSYGPSQAAEHFKKLECFCFAKQTFLANEKRLMPVVFVVDSNLPKDINTITLSYSFFEMPGGVPAVNTAPAGKLDSPKTSAATLDKSES